MAHVVVMTGGLAGVLHGSLELAGRLARDGHRVTYLSPADVAQAVEGDGLPFVRLAPYPLDPAPQLERGEGVARIAHKLGELRTARARRAAGVEVLAMDEFAAVLWELSPDLLVVDAELYPHVFTAVAQGVRTALLDPFFCHAKHAGVPPLQSAVVPGHGLAGSRAGIELAWFGARSRRRLAKARTWLRYFGTDLRGVLLEHARRTGFERGRLNELDWLTVFTFRGLPTLCTTSLELDLPHRPPPWKHHVGPLIYAGAGRERSGADRAAADRLEQLGTAASRTGRPLVACTMSTLVPDGRGFLDAVIELGRLRPDWTVVVGLGRALRAPDELPANVHAFDWVPQLRLLELAQAMIHHGGTNTVHECVDRAVPAVVCPTGQLDHAGNAARIAHHRLGLVLDKARRGGSELAAAVESILDDAPLRERIHAQRRALRRYTEERVLERIVLQLLGEEAGPVLVNGRT